MSFVELSKQFSDKLDKLKFWEQTNIELSLKVKSIILVNSFNKFSRIFGVYLE